MVEVVPYNEKDHYGFILKWLKARELPTYLAKNLPQIGFIAKHGPIPIACAFLRRVEGGYGMLDSLITNPGATSAGRHEAIDGIVSRILKIGHEIGILKLLAYSVDTGILERSQKFGFKQMDEKLIVIDL